MNIRCLPSIGALAALQDQKISFTLRCFFLLISVLAQGEVSKWHINLVADGRNQVAGTFQRHFLDHLCSLPTKMQPLSFKALSQECICNSYWTKPKVFDENIYYWACFLAKCWHPMYAVIASILLLSWMEKIFSQGRAGRGRAGPKIYSAGGAGHMLRISADWNHMIQQRKH